MREGVGESRVGEKSLGESEVQFEHRRRAAVRFGVGVRLTSVVVLVAELIGVLDERGIVEGDLTHALHQVELAPGRPGGHYEVVAVRESEGQRCTALKSTFHHVTPVRKGPHGYKTVIYIKVAFLFIRYCKG